MLYSLAQFRKLSFVLSVKNTISSLARQNIRQYKDRSSIYVVILFPRTYATNNSKITYVSPNRERIPQLNVAYSTTQVISTAEYEKISDETLESLTEYFEELIENAAHLTEADVSYGDGVLTVKFGHKFGTYVINRQTPNKQIWLSSPLSGPKRYDFVNGQWIYKHDGKSLHELLNNEIPNVVETKTNFGKCLFSGMNSHTATDK